MVLVFSDCSQAVDSQRVIRMTPHRKRPQKNPLIPPGTKGQHPSVVPPTFHATNAVACSSRASFLADNGCPPRQPAASEGGSVPGQRVVFAAIIAGDGSQPVAICRCRKTPATRPALRHNYSYHIQHITSRTDCKACATVASHATLLSLQSFHSEHALVLVGLWSRYTERV
jgi:hypothetical protein